MSKKQELLCPKCYEPVFKHGWHHGETNPKDLFGHLKSQKLDCNYRGSAPIGVDKLKRKGYDEHTSKGLKDVVTSRRYHRFVVTSAQNATPIHKKAWKTLLNYCKVNKAQLLVVPYRYKNPTSRWSQKAKSHDWWAVDLAPYIIGHRVSLTPHILLLADIMVQPTADRPLNGLESMTGEDSAIIGHPKLEMTTIATPQQKFPKLLTTTGSITVKNYIESKAGKKGEHHHTFGAALIEVDGSHFHLRQLNIKNDGSFCDLLTEYSGDKIRKYDRVPALVMGDTHVEVIDPGVVNATFKDSDSIIKILKPETLVWHDVFDGQSINHHERNSFFNEYVKFQSGRRNVERELNRTFDFIDDVTPSNVKNIFVPSNHNGFLREWVENVDPRKDVENVVFWAESIQALKDPKLAYQSASGPVVPDLFAFWGKKKLKTVKQAKFLNRGESFLIQNIEVGYHGDRGPGGSRGSRQGFRKIGVKSIIGHTHAPGIMDGAYQVGTSSRLDLTYMSGSPSNWLHTHCIIYPNGKRCLINIINGKWRIP